MRRIVLLGATGSIGRQTLEVLRGHPDDFELVGIAADRRGSELAAIAREFAVPHAALYDEAAAQAAAAEFPATCQLHTGAEGLETLASLPDVDTVVMAIVGTRGLIPALAALRHGRDLALASKEILVMAGAFVTAAAERHGARILPVDSEHNAIFQCLEGQRRDRVRKLWLTASGGAFRDWPLADLARVTPALAIQHPNWSMGPKVTVDSSTMANKGLEVIEARWLFGVSPDQIDVVVHPQSIVHSLVEFVDGSVLAQMSPPSMTFAIQHVLHYPERRRPVTPTLDLRSAMTLDFRPPEPARYPCLALARAALEAGGSAPAVFNAANEVAVSAFLAGTLSFAGIPAVIERTLATLQRSAATVLDEVLADDLAARRLASELIARTGT